MLGDSRFIRACRGLATDATPVWLMRQAGRYMPEYRAIRARHTILEIIRTPELAAEVTLQPLQTFDLDAAIIFADILPPLIGMGLKLEFVKGEGPQIDNPITTPYDVDCLAAPPAEETLASTLEAIRIVSAELSSRGIPLLGFAGAPFTLASYAIEGESSRSFARTKALMYGEPAAWRRLMNKLVTVQADYLLKQVEAGASALQVFDSWAGLALGQQEYIRFVQPYNRKLFEKLAQAGVPTINFSTGTSSYLPEVAACGGDVISVDWRMPIDWAWEQIALARPIQGNLDPAALLAPWHELKYQVDDVLDRAEAAKERGGPAHIFNLGHGILPMTPPDNVKRLVDYVHERTSKAHGAASKEKLAGGADSRVGMSRPAPAQPSRRQTIGVLIMAYGGPNSLDEIPGYLADIRGGRPTTPAVLDEISHNYRQIGGRSPLLAISRRQMEAVAEHFDPERYRFYLGMRHWAPWIEEVVGQMVADGINQAISLVLAPHFSQMSVARYHQKIEDGLRMVHGDIQFKHINSYHDAPKLIQALANRVVEALDHWPQDERDQVHVVFSAHSLPVRILKSGDPYDAQLRETARLVAQRAGLPNEQWSWSYQSAGRSPEPWLGPQLDEHIVALAGRGVHDIVSVPVGFVSDHVEILYDIDIQAQEVASEHGIRLERPPALNDDPLFIEALAELIRERAGAFE